MWFLLPEYSRNETHPAASSSSSVTNPGSCGDTWDEKLNRTATRRRRILQVSNGRIALDLPIEIFGIDGDFNDIHLLAVYLDGMHNRFIPSLLCKVLADPKEFFNILGCLLVQRLGKNVEELVSSANGPQTPPLLAPPLLAPPPLSAPPPPPKKKKINITEAICGDSYPGETPHCHPHRMSQSFFSANQQ